MSIWWSQPNQQNFPYSTIESFKFVQVATFLKEIRNINCCCYIRGETREKFIDLFRTFSHPAEIR